MADRTVDDEESAEFSDYSSSSGISDPFIDEEDTEREEEQTEQSEETLHGIEPYRFEPEVTLSSLGITMMLSVAAITAMGDK